MLLCGQILRNNIKVLRPFCSSTTNMTLVVDQLMSKSSKIHISSKAKVESLLQSLISGGVQKLQLIVDFDYTLTRAHKDGEKVDCSWGVMENSSLLPPHYTAETHALRAKYLPIEHDHNMTIEQKTPHMVEWYTEANRLLQKAGVKKEMFSHMVQASNVEFRDGTSQMLDSLSQVQVPVLILSAGLGDLLVEILDNFGAYHRANMKVVSNFLAYGDDGQVVGLDGKMIHVYNKNEDAIHDSEYFKTHMEGRSNVILLGDSLGDLRMADGVDNPQAVLKIGFLNDVANMKERLPTYLESYDIVLVDDQTMDVPRDILTRILGN